MNITKEYLVNSLNEMDLRREKALADYNALHGAVQILKSILADLERPEEPKEAPKTSVE